MVGGGGGGLYHENHHRGHDRGERERVGTERFGFSQNLTAIAKGLMSKKIFSSFFLSLFPPAFSFVQGIIYILV